MKTNSLFFRCMLLMLLPTFSIMNVWAQGPYPNTGAQTVCINSSEPYGVILTSGSTYSWSIIPGTGGNGTIINGSAPNNLISVNWTSAGTCTLRVVETNSSNCVGPNNDIQITVNPINTISLTSATGTDGQTVCINSPITDITYGTAGATGASVTGLPSGVTGSFAGNIVTISGTPTASGLFTYTVTLTGGCGTVSTTGTITVTTTNTIALTSATGTDGQTACISSPITNITYGTAGATGASVTGLPSGVTSSFAGNIVTISGTPTASGLFTYTVTLTGGCGTVSTTGTIMINALPPTSPIYHN